MRSIKNLKSTDKELFEKFNGVIYEIHSQFYAWKHLQIKENEKSYNSKRDFWGVIIPTLQQSFLLNLANVFDKDDRVLSVFIFLNSMNENSIKSEIEQSISSKRGIIKNLMVWRSNFLAHKSLYFVFNPKELEKKFKINNGDIEDLLSLLVSVLDKTKLFFDSHDITNYQKDYYRKLEEQCKNDLDFVLKHGLNLKTNDIN